MTAAQLAARIEAIRVLRLQPGDAIVVDVNRKITVEQASALQAHVSEAFPGHKVVICIPETGIRIEEVVDMSTPDSGAPEGTITPTLWNPGGITSMSTAEPPHPEAPAPEPGPEPSEAPAPEAEPEQAPHPEPPEHVPSEEDFPAATPDPEVAPEEASEPEAVEAVPDE